MFDNFGPFSEKSTDEKRQQAVDQINDALHGLHNHEGVSIILWLVRSIVGTAPNEAKTVFLLDVIEALGADFEYHEIDEDDEPSIEDPSPSNSLN